MDSCRRRRRLIGRSVRLALPEPIILHSIMPRSRAGGNWKTSEMADLFVVIHALCSTSWQVGHVRVALF